MRGMRAGWIGVALVAAALAGCGRSEQSRVMERAIQSAAPDGTKVQVESGGDRMTITTTDASGAKSQMRIGAAVTEAELGVPFYPGAQAADGASSKTETPEGVSMTTTLVTADPTDKVATFYRERMKELAGGRQLIDVQQGDGSVMLAAPAQDDKAAAQVHLNKTDKGTEILIAVVREKKDGK